MNRAELIEKAKVIIADGCGCDHWCETERGREAMAHCGCRLDAEKIVALTLKTAAEQLEKPWPGADSAANIVRNLP